VSRRVSTRWIVAIAAAGLVLRVVVALVVARRITGDPWYYTQQGRLIARGHWFVDPYFLRVLHVYDESAAHPPLYSLYFAMVSALGLTTDTAYRLAAALLGGVAVGAIGFAARRVAGARAGIVAAALAACYPYLWSTDMLVLSETLVALLAAVLVLVVYRYRDTPTTAGLVGCGVVVALAALTRAEMLLLLPLLAWPVAWRAGGAASAAAARVRRLAVVSVATLVPLVPWVAYNIARFDEPVYLSTGAGGTFADSACDSVFYGPNTGWWDQRCIVDYAGDESVRDRKLRAHAFEYLGNHQSALPRVVAVRIGRVWEVHKPWQTAKLDWLEGRGKFAGIPGLLVHFATVPLAIAGGFVLVARRRGVWPFVAIALTVTLTAAAFYGAVRFRAPADVALVVLAAVALDALIAAASSTNATAASTASIGSAVMRNR
jgi:4-amino-4-deoxy-L-arabinose transferase-like glycosyltransferase